MIYHYPLLNRLYQCEDEYLTTVSSRARQESAVQVGIIKQSRMAADAAYRTLVETVNALTIINGAAPYTPFIDPVNAIIDRMKTVLTTRRTVNIKKGSSPTPALPEGGRESINSRT